MSSNFKKGLRKLLPLTITAAFSLGATQGALAAASPGQRIPNKPGSDIIQAINNLGYKMQAIALAGERTTAQIANAADKELSNVMRLNSENDVGNSQINTTTTQNIQTSIHNSLAQFPNDTLTYSSTNDPIVQQSQNEKSLQDNLTTSLTLGINASDTLYSAVNNIDSATYYTQYPQSKPQITYDQYFDVNTLTNPDNYTQEQQQAAQYFITYLTRNYESQTDDIDFDKLRNYLDQFSNDPVTLGQKLQAFRNNEVYKKFQLNERSNIAAKSVALKVFNDFLAERIPLQSKDPDAKLEAISKQMGVTPQQITVPDPNNPGHTMTVWSYVSPLQINNYMANHRINDPSWYGQVASGSTEDLLRKLVIIMAESESLTEQNHLDNEKILTQLATMNIQTSAANKMLNANQTQDINNVIASTISQGGGSSSTDSSSSSSSSNSSNTTNSQSIDPTTGMPTNTTTPTDSSQVPSNSTDIPTNSTDIPSSQTNTNSSTTNSNGSTN